MMTPPGDRDEAAASGLRQLLEIVFKHHTAIVATFVAVVGTVVVGTFMVTPIYQVESRILVKFGRENIYRSEVGDDRSQVVASNTEEIINSETSILTSRDLISSMVSTITVEALYPDLIANPPRRGTPLEAAVDRFLASLTVDALKKSSVIEIALQHHNPAIAARALNLLVEDYKGKHLAAYSDPKSSYLEGQLQLYEQRLTASQSELQAFKQNNGVVSLDEQRSLLLRQRSDLDTSLKTTLSRIREVQQGLATLKGQLQTVAQDVTLSTENERYRSIDDAKNQLLALELKEQDLLRQYTERNQLVVTIRREMEIVRAFVTRQEDDIKSRVRTGQNIVYQELQRDLLKLQVELPAQEAKAASLRGQVAELDVAIPKIDRTESGFENLKRELSVNDRNYRGYQERVEAARTLEDLNQQKSANISVIQTASAPSVPIKPRKGLTIGLAGIIGLLAGLGIAIASEMSSLGLSTPESVERRLGVPVLATIVMRR
jgi:uncharacterized protein involved in exopolysaccharide biosynthesis